MIVHAKIHAHQIVTIMEIVVAMENAHVMDTSEQPVILQIHAKTQLALHAKKIQIVDGVLITVFVKTNTSQKILVVLKHIRHLPQHAQIQKFKQPLQVSPKIELQQLL